MLPTLQARNSGTQSGRPPEANHAHALHLPEVLMATNHNSISLLLLYHRVDISIRKCIRLLHQDRCKLPDRFSKRQIIQTVISAHICQNLTDTKPPPKSQVSYGGMLSRS